MRRLILTGLMAWILLAILSASAAENISTPSNAIGGNDGLILRRFSLDRIFTYQGILKNSSGDPVPDANYNLTFRLYNQPSGGALLWTSSPTQVATSSGYFTTQIGPIPLRFDSTYYLSLQVQSDPEMATREKLTSSPYAVTTDTANYAFKADTAGYALNGGSVGGGWTDDGSRVRLTASTDSVGIGTSSPSAKLQVQGTLRVTDKANIGPNNVNTGICSFVVGDSNAAIGAYSTIGGGYGDSAKAVYSGVASGYFNKAGDNASDTGAFIGGGMRNTVKAKYATITGGLFNATGYTDYATIGGGYANLAYGVIGTVAGGQYNCDWGYNGFVGGGYSNQAGGGIFGDSEAVVVGGNTNRAYANCSAITGGKFNAIQAWAAYSAIGGGCSDTVNAPYAGIASGYLNVAGSDSTATAAFVGGGQRNQALGKFSTIDGGTNNWAVSPYAIVAGGAFNSARAPSSGICSGSNNTASNSLADTGAFVGGGVNNFAASKYCAIAGGINNIESFPYAAIGGGINNTTAAPYTTIGGGGQDTASNNWATVSGGSHNVASGWGAMIPGGAENIAGGTYDFAAGIGAHAIHNGCFIWADDAGGSYNSDRGQEAKFRSGGGVRFDINGLAHWVEIWNNGSGRLINTSTGAYLSTAGAWTNNSDRNLKENFTPIDGTALLSKISQLSITRWNYKSDDKSITHIGPMAQDFKRIFEVGNDSTTISSLDPAGVALAGVQELLKQNKELKAENENMKGKIDDLERRLTELENRR